MNVPVLVIFVTVLVQNHKDGGVRTQTEGVSGLQMSSFYCFNMGSVLLWNWLLVQKFIAYYQEDDGL